MKTLIFLILLAAIVFYAMPTQAQTVQVCRIWYSAWTVTCYTYELSTATPTAKPKRHREATPTIFEYGSWRVTETLEAYPAPSDEPYPAPGATSVSGGR